MKRAVLTALLSVLTTRASKFTLDDIPDLQGKVAIVTGGNTGIGKVTCRVLLSKNARVYMAARTAHKAQEAIEDIKRQTGKADGIYFLQCDLADLESVKRAAEEFISKEQSLHMLFNSAGVMLTPVEEVTKQGYDLQFGTNVLGHACLTMLLLPTLMATASSSPSGRVRVISSASRAHVGAPWGGIVWDALKDTPRRRKLMGPSICYFQSKWANVVFAKELAKRYGGKGIVSTSLDPGIIRTDLWKNVSRLAKPFISVLLRDVEHGALTQLYAGTVPDAAELNGKFLVPWARVGTARVDTNDVYLGDKLWNWLEGEIRQFETQSGAV